MTSEANNPANDLQRLIAEGHISEDALQTITAIPAEKLQSFFDTSTGTAGLVAKPQTLSTDEILRLSILAAHLTDGLQIEDDARLAAILESLTIECHLTLAHIAQLTHVDIGDIENALENPQTVPAETKYAIAIRGSYLINAVNQARE
ncbi:HTH domain-containing protein [Glaciihabitans sp. dw_435]|uniref:HTH domain-containing protein n=1 Tax=Glaciihabitans sp. dw_435 TaxID=2720081 RepID=UPI001BD4FE2B|nr:HTH domain-containing protein [Glaciihabitans sp. dw_435]